MNEVYILLGSNEGNREEKLGKAVSIIAETCGPVIRKSSLYETAAWGLEDQPDFLNQVICINTQFSPESLLQKTQQAELTLGRQRHIKWGQRTIDIDILLYNEAVVQQPNLMIPHPFLQDRRFVMVPLAEIAPDKIHPLLHQSMKELLKNCQDPLPVRLFQTGNQLD
ncbi:2-amino-4-hydroxy-6-hydroxymethyldihydropteridine diphosphokinase [Taibaiella soli]|uniref:2-amino-4-hydroxy-6-hydroxymethyldihydropteridine pyrophosphokinase n=1 Tax=Taibaiella soli TaxID=1649169 RepID=A0A2W2ASA2_9BACT|nr:2-amino-4-hydroxy-6-hydroxymethyldihydropteridine diphosphokinase [Taibaiella soli]PZF70874.1 2-amino-4-hydroxy-6-hydroxymethyldihydropteridine diphosphokinase [Taibaiella soli]